MITAEMINNIEEKFKELIGKSKKEEWKNSMLEGFKSSIKRILNIVEDARKIPASSVQIEYFHELQKDVTLVGLTISAACEAGVLSFNTETKILCLVDELVDIAREVRYPLLKPRKKNKYSLGISDVGTILETMPLYFKEDIQLPFPENWDMVNYIEGINEGILSIEGDIYVPIMNDFRGRIYASTDVGNYTSDKLQRHALLIEGLPTVALDTRSSCILLTSLLTRDNKALKSVFTLGLKNHKVDPYKQVFKRIPELQGLERDEQKKCVMQYIYCGNAKVKSTCGEYKDAFVDAFASALPKSQAFREACLNAWDSNCEEYLWELPDGFQVNQRVEKVLYELGIQEILMEIKVGGHITNVHPNWKVPCTLQKGDNGTRSIAPNVIHSIDAYIMRELVRRCNNNFKIDLHDIGIGEFSSTNPNALTIYKMWQETKMVSLNILNYLNKGDNIPEDYFNAILGIIRTLPKSRFFIKPIHDEFCCRTEFRKDMVNVFNQLLVELYKSDYLDYVSKELELKIKADPISNKMVDLLLENTFLLHED